MPWLRLLDIDPLKGETHEHLPLGGRVNLRTLRHHVRQMLTTLRQHQFKLPRIKSLVKAGLFDAIEVGFGLGEERVPTFRMVC